MMYGLSCGFDEDVDDDVFLVCALLERDLETIWQPVDDGDLGVAAHVQHE